MVLAVFVAQQHLTCHAYSIVDDHYYYYIINYLFIMFTV